MATNSYMQIGHNFDGVCMYWKMLTLIVADLLLNVCIVESYVHAFINVESDVYIHIGDDEYFVFILAKTDFFSFILSKTIDTYVSWGEDLGDDWYHMHIDSCLGALHNLTCVIFAYVLGEYFHWWNIGKSYTWWNWWICEDLLVYFHTCMLDDY
jgi:hypothetical protein